MAAKSRILGSAAGVSDTRFRRYVRIQGLLQRSGSQVNVVSQFTYTLESLIQAGRSNLKVADVPIGVNPTTRPSSFVSLETPVRSKISRNYLPGIRHAQTSSFLQHSIALFAAVGLALFGRFGWYYLSAGGEGHIQSLIVGAVCLLVSVQMLMLGLLADLLRTNRVITERVLRRVRNIELSLGTYGNTEEEPDSDV